jgi:hypothetical protein
VIQSDRTWLSFHQGADGGGEGASSSSRRGVERVGGVDGGSPLSPAKAGAE